MIVDIGKSVQEHQGQTIRLSIDSTWIGANLRSLAIAVHLVQP